MRIALLTNHLPPVLDGVGDYSFHLANELQRVGHTVSVICSQHPSIEQAVSDGHFDMQVSASVSDWNWRAIKPIRQFLVEQQPDWLLLQYVPNSFQRWAMPIWLPVLLWLIKQKGVRISITFHEAQIRMVYWPIKYWVVAATQRFICLLLTHIADVIVTSIDLYASMLRTYTRKPIHLIPIPSNIQPISLNEDEVKRLRQSFIAPNAERVISTFGLRNQDLLLRVFSEIFHSQPNTKLLICSKLKIETTQQLYDRLKEQIIVTGFMDASDVYRYLRASDVFFIPDFVDERGQGGTCNKSTALAAALAAGLPVVGTRGDMNNTLLFNTPGVSLYDFRDVSGIAKAISQQLNETNSRPLHEEIIQFSNTHLGWQAVVSKQLKVLKLFGNTIT